MRYMIIIYGNRELWESFPPAVAQRAIAAQDAFNQEFTASGELLCAYGLADVVQAKTVAVRDGLPAVTGSPYLETKEFLSSFMLIDVDSEERALELAGDPAGARAAYRTAAGYATNVPERRYLDARAAALAGE